MRLAFFKIGIQDVNFKHKPVQRKGFTKYLKVSDASNVLDKARHGIVDTLKLETGIYKLLECT
jgi:hypothetical protein